MNDEPEVQVGDCFRARGVQGSGITFAVERVLPGHVFGALTVMGKDAEKGAFRWARFHEMFEPIEES